MQWPSCNRTKREKAQDKPSFQHIPWPIPLSHSPVQKLIFLSAERLSRLSWLPSWLTILAHRACILCVVECLASSIPGAETDTSILGESHYHPLPRSHQLGSLTYKHPSSFPFVNVSYVRKPSLLFLLKLEKY